MDVCLAFLRLVGLVRACVGQEVVVCVCLLCRLLRGQTHLSMHSAVGRVGAGAGIVLGVMVGVLFLRILVVGRRLGGGGRGRKMWSFLLCWVFVRVCVCLRFAVFWLSVTDSCLPCKRTVVYHAVK